MSPTTSIAAISSRFSALRVLRRGALVCAALLFAPSARAELKLVEHWPNSANTCVDAPLRLTFDQPPVLGGKGKIEVCRSSDGQAVATITLGEASYVDSFGMEGKFMLQYEPVRIDGKEAFLRLHSRSLVYGESYFVRIEPGVFRDFAGIASGWTFTTKAALPRNPDRIEVSGDGTADFCTVQGAVDKVEPHRAKPAIIYIHPGRYDGLVRIGRERTQVHLIGANRHTTVITSINNDKLNPGWIQRAVLGVEGDDFSLENLTVENRTPYKGSQAEAVYINAQRGTLRNADFLSYQDTLHLSGSIRVTDCRIEGDVDYVWGYGSALLERCELHTLHDGYLVQARNAPGKTGYVFVDCKLTAAPGVKRCWLARIDTERFPASQVTFIRCQMGDHIPAAGWEVTGPTSATLNFAEYLSTDLSGHPRDVTQRHPAGKQLTDNEAKAQSNPAILQGPNQ